MKKLLALAVVILGFTAVSFGQAKSATASASATIVSAMNITNAGNLNFGNIQTTGAGKVLVATDGTPTYPNAPAVSGYAIAGTITAAKFDVTGSPDATYSISAIAPIKVNSAASDMDVDNFVTSPSLIAGKLDASGKQTILVGATLNVKAAQAPGFYTNTTGFTVTVNYN